jgi:hypothetical protein
MLIENSSDIVKSSKSMLLTHGEQVEILNLINGQVLLLAENGISLFKDVGAIEDPLANGLIHSAELTPEFFLLKEEGRFMKMTRSGLVGLFDDKVILITPNDIQLFPDRASALRNQDEIMVFHLG